MGVKLGAVNGMNISQAKQICRFAFSDFFLKAEKNYEKMRYDFYLVNKIRTYKNNKEHILLLSEECNVEYFKKFWNDTDAKDGAMRSGGYWNIIILEQSY